VKRIYAEKKVSPRGASRTELDKPGAVWLGRGLGVCIFVAILIAVFFAASKAIDFDVAIDRPVASVAVEGEFRFVSRARITELVTPLVNKKFLQLDLDAIKHNLEQEPYVEYAVLSRRWPDRLAVKIVEQRPIAQWGGGGFVNQRGEVIETDDVDFVKSLPALYGDKTQAEKIMLQYQRISKLLRVYGLDVAVLKSDEKSAWQLQLSNGLHVIIGRDQVLEKVQRFVKVYSGQLKDKLNAIAAVDVRYNNGVAVRWQNPSQQQSGELAWQAHD
jgi:cell division protein FtsQ